MARSRWARVYTSVVAAEAGRLFELLADLPQYPRWLPPSESYGATTDVTPYPVRLGTRYHDGKPSEPGSDWWGEVTGFRPPGSLDFHHVIHVRQLRAVVDVHIHYSFETALRGTADGAGADTDSVLDAPATSVQRWLVLDITMPWILRPLRPAIVQRFDRENVRTLAALKAFAETNPN